MSYEGGGSALLMRELEREYSQLSDRDLTLRKRLAAVWCLPHEESIAAAGARCDSFHSKQLEEPDRNRLPEPPQYRYGLSRPEIEVLRILACPLEAQ